MKAQEDEALTPGRVVRNTAGFLSGSIGTKLLSFLVVTTAARHVGVSGIGLVFFAEAIGAIVFRTTDFGFYQVLMRRSARSEAAIGAFKTALGVRVVGTVASTAVFAGAMFVLLPEQSFLLTGFFFCHGLFVLHELGRGLLVGRERFGLNAGLAIGARIVGTTISIVGMREGGGLSAWLLGSLVAELLQLTGVFVFAVRTLAREVRPVARSLVSEGLTFWTLDVLRLASTQLQIVVVTGWLTFEAAGFLGLADRLNQGGLLSTASVSFAAFPFLARQRSLVIRRSHVLLVVALSLATAGGIFAFAPFIARVLLGKDLDTMVSVIRILSAAVLLQALAQPLDYWLRAKDREATLLGLAAIEAVVATVSLAFLIPRASIDGAAYALVIAAALRLAGVTVITRGALRDSKPRE